MQTLVSVVTRKERKMLGALIAVTNEVSYLLRHGLIKLPAYSEHLNYLLVVIFSEQGKPVSLPARGSEAVRRIDGGAGIGIAKKRMLPCNRADRSCVASMGQYYLTGNGTDFAMVFKLENICGTDVGSKANDGGVSRWCSFPHDGGFPPPPCELAADQYREGFICC
jgi:hypothetical protein